jgi:hypothetical protein
MVMLAPGSTGCGERHAHVRLVVVARAPELGERPKIHGPGGLDEREAAHVDGAPVGDAPPATPALDGLAHEQRALVLKGVEVEVNPQLAGGRAARVAPRDAALAVHRVRRRIERGAKDVVGDGRRVRREVRVAVPRGPVHGRRLSVRRGRGREEQTAEQRGDHGTAKGPGAYAARS